ncbi:hypothetical protein RCG23_05090 [Neobacillus sp. PS3-34]|uniref:hypothetical protein n=1 Tax=Neobacillus sp. PS3-34 TaxID=3070678 RepID=UPI0027E01A4C|nr:hypothetical protein [Neobacillus sp. PS3-34]WML49402.1 hypothetical protein RCG23_05090 [Neobacillus sp. PS3-34]
MSKKLIITALIISIILTGVSPYYFKTYFEKKPEPLRQTVHFGGPLPFLEQIALLPEKDKNYPAEANFQSPLKTKTHLKPVALILSIIIIFALVLSLSSIFIRFFKKTDRNSF